MKISRREFLRVSGLTAVATAAAACAGPTPQVIEKEKVVQETVVVEKEVTVEKVVQETVIVEKQVTVEKVVTATPAPPMVNEAPMLAELVQAGKLPPVDERLPLDPTVCLGREGFIGQYGGVLRMPYGGWGYRWHVRELFGQTQCLLRWSEDMALIPWAAESIEPSADAKTWTVRLRKGMKWSNGEPFTSADFKWTYEYLAKDDNLNVDLVGKGIYRQTTPDGQVLYADLECPDDFTVVFKYQLPRAFGFYDLRGVLPLASEYMKEFHPDLTSDKAGLEKAWTDAGAGTWQEYFNTQVWYALNPDYPQVSGWAPGKAKFPDDPFVVTRNPYYFVVDPEGSQLPYIDQQQFRYFENWDTVKLWMLGGEMDLWPEVAIPDYQTFKESADKGGYHLIKNSQAQHRGLQINLTSKDERLREFINKKEVRWAISHAINRDEMNEMLYLGLAVPRQYSPIRASPNYDPKATNAHIEYDPKLSSELLDQAGYAEKNAQGQRLWPGTQEPVSFICECHNDPDDAAVMIQGYLAKVGITMNIKPVSRVLFDEHTRSNDVNAGMWGGDRCFMPIVSPQIFLGTVIDRVWAVAWALWRNDAMHSNPNGEEPPADHFISKIWDIWDNEVTQESDPAGQKNAFQKILDIWAEEIPMFCCVGDWAMFTYAQNGLKNVKEGTVLDWGTSWLSVIPIEAFSWEDPATQSVGKRI